VVGAKPPVGESQNCGEADAREAADYKTIAKPRHACSAMPPEALPSVSDFAQ
jgi:hypothetical protein